MWVYDIELTYNRAIELFQPFIDTHGPWYTVNYIVTHYQISERELLDKIHTGWVRAIDIGGHYYISEHTINTVEGLEPRPAKSTIHKDQTSFLDLVDGLDQEV